MFFGGLPPGFEDAMPGGMPGGRRSRRNVDTTKLYETLGVEKDAPQAHACARGRARASVRGRGVRARGGGCACRERSVSLKGVRAPCA
eukprot:6207883-Pleurochrysis_carterae.AAC.2